MTTDIVRREAIEEISRNRAFALSGYEETWDTLNRAIKAHSDAVAFGSNRYIEAPLLTSNKRPCSDGKEEFLAKLRRNVDRDIWNSLILGTKLGSLMDREERDRFAKQLEADPPEATPDTIRATLERLTGESDLIFRRDLVNAFSSFCRDYKSNDGFKIGKRIVMTNVVVFEPKLNWWRMAYRREPEIYDLDRVMHLLDNKEAPERFSTPTCLVAAMDQAMRDKKQEATTPYWHARWHKNGNGHLMVLREDLREKANLILANWFGATLGAGHAAATAAPAAPTPSPTAHYAENFFATPKALAAETVARAEIEDIHICLEPSAGEGALVSEMLLAGAARVDAIEMNESRAAGLEATLQGMILAKRATVRAGDFLTMDPEPIYDRIVMNPPFSKRQDGLHVAAALKWLKPGGRLVALMSSAVVWRDIKEYTWLRGRIRDWGGVIEELPKDSFASSGTKVRTVRVILDKPKFAI